MYRKVKNAWVVLDSNNNNELHVLFDEDWTRPLVDFEDRLVCLPQSNGMVFYGAYDSVGKRWSSRAGVMNRNFPDVQIIDIVEVDTQYHGMGRSAAIVKDFAEQILKDFHIPFHFVLGEDTAYDLRWDLEQNDRRELIGKSTKSPRYGKVKITGATWTMFGHSEQYTVTTTKGEVLSLPYADLPKVYRGLTWAQYQDELKKLGISMTL